MSIPKTNITSARQALRESKALKSYWSGETLLSQRILIYIASLLEQQQKSKRRRKLTRWQQLAMKVMKEGGTLKEAAERWRIERNKQ